jgi:zinc protease
MKSSFASHSLLVMTLAFAMAGGAPGANAASSGIPKTFTLANGLEVVVIEDHRAPVVTNMVWYRVGSADEERGKSGLAHFLEHLMFKGTKTVAKGEFSKIVAREGGQDNAFTSWDYTGYWERFQRDRLELAIKLEADRMVNLVLADDQILSERDVILEERSARVENDPGSILAEQVNAAQFLNHPYGVPIIGWRHEMAGLTRQDALAFYKRHYAPDNAILVVAGDVSAAEVKTLASKYFGALARSGIQARKRPQEPPPLSPRRVILKDARATQAQFVRSYLAPSYLTGKPNEGYAIDVAAQVLGGGSTSVLYRALVEDMKLATSASASYDGDAIDQSSVSVSATPAPGVTPEKLEAAIDAVLAKTLAGGLAASDVERAKTSLRASAIYARDNQQSQARIYGSGRAQGMALEEIAAWPDRVVAIQKAQAEAVLRAFLKPERSVTGWLLPGEAKSNKARGKS